MAGDGFIVFAEQINWDKWPIWIELLCSSNLQLYVRANIDLNTVSLSNLFIDKIDPNIYYIFIHQSASKLHTESSDKKKRN